MMVVWHVDELKISYVDSFEITIFWVPVQNLWVTYGTQGKVTLLPGHGP